MKGRVGTRLLISELTDEQRELRQNGEDDDSIICHLAGEGLDHRNPREQHAMERALSGDGTQATPAAHAHRDLRSFKVGRNSPEFYSLDAIVLLSSGAELAPSPEDQLIEKEEYRNVSIL